MRAGGSARRRLGPPETSGSFAARAPPLKAAGPASGWPALHLCQPAARRRVPGGTRVPVCSSAVPSGRHEITRARSGGLIQAGSSNRLSAARWGAAQTAGNIQLSVVSTLLPPVIPPVSSQNSPSVPPAWLRPRAPRGARPGVQPSTDFHLQKDAHLPLPPDRACSPFGSPASVIHANKIVIPHVSAWLVSMRILNTSLLPIVKKPTTTTTTQPKPKHQTPNLEVTISFIFPFLLPV